MKVMRKPKQDHLRTLALNKIEERLEAIRNIEDGWSSGAGKSFTDGWIDFFMNICRENYPSGLPAPKIGPNGDGGINVEWVANRATIDLEIGDDTLKMEDNFRSVHFLILDLKDEESTENTLDLTSTKSWKCISKSFNMLPK